MGDVRVRPVAVQVIVEAVLDDGESLTPVNMKPVEMTAAQFAEFDLDAQIDWVQGQIEAQREVQAPTAGD